MRAPAAAEDSQLELPDHQLASPASRATLRQENYLSKLKLKTIYLQLDHSIFIFNLFFSPYTMQCEEKQRFKFWETFNREIHYQLLI